MSFTNVENKITKITTWGGGRTSGYVKVYNLQFTDEADVSTWSNYKEGGKIRVNLKISLSFAYFRQLTSQSPFFKFSRRESKPIRTLSILFLQRN